MGKIKEFGQKLKSLRAKTGLTQPELAKASGVTTSIVNDLENGIRTAGVKTINKIALGLGLEDQDRYLLLLQGLALSKRDFLIPDLAEYPPELLNFLPYVLRRAGIQARDIGKIDLPNRTRKNLKLTLKSKKVLHLEIRLSMPKNRHK